MIAFHEQHRANVTLGAVVVPLEEGHRFGILETDAGGRVVSFEEKPREPRGSLGSMGIYVFDRDALIRVLIEDARAAETGGSPTQHDFGRNIIPAMVERGERVYAYPFAGYWQDVGTIHSYWEAHMKLLGDHPSFDLYDPSWVIHTRSEERPPAYIRSGAQIVREPGLARLHHQRACRAQRTLTRCGCRGGRGRTEFHPALRYRHRCRQRDRPRDHR